MNFLNWFLNFLIICYIILINLPYFINTYTWCLQVEANRCIYDEEAAPQSQHHPTNRQVWHPDTKGAVPPQEQGSDRSLCHPFRFNNKLIYSARKKFVAGHITTSTNQFSVMILFWSLFFVTSFSYLKVKDAENKSKWQLYALKTYKTVQINNITYLVHFHKIAICEYKVIQFITEYINCYHTILMSRF